ncbi:hypothetical protein F4779DRAFT_386429 [Xylariaceae sp. FL0662B]|nr:hypothetical protein F4779DRAFT_386429 [Xylariaceae sp. FL0662B]
MPLQKSFSEQNGSSKNLKTRQHWNKSKSYSAGTHSSTTRNAPTRPLQPVSEITKNKLNAFNFRPPLAKPGDDEDRALNQASTISEEPAEETAAKRSPEEATPLPASKESTVTPVSRLAWHDLIGMSEAKEEEDEVSPNERIGWDTRDDQTYKLSPMMSRRRGKKRARSSSPISSPASNSKINTPPVHRRKLSEALRSPYADPALQLWDRFSLGGSASVTPLGGTTPALAQLMVSSSPRASKVQGGGTSEGGLRRAISCGANWPKRRRVERTDAIKPMDVMAEESSSDHSKSSMVNALLETVTGEINKSKAVQVRQDALRSPSPKKKKPYPPARATQSPSRHLSPSTPTPPISTETDMVESNGAKPDALVDILSDYGDDDFDDDTLMELGANIGAQTSTSPSHGEGEESNLPPLDTGQAADQPLADRESKSFDDDFTDLDDDVFAAAEDLIAQVDSSHSSRGNAARESLNAGTDDLAEDVYGDDFGGDFDFDAAEIAATQSAKKTNGSLPLVRR